MDFGILGDGNNLAQDAVALNVLVKQVHGTSYCGGCIRCKKRQEQLYIKTGCTGKAQKENI